MGITLKDLHSVTKSCLTLCDPMDYSPPGFSVHGISQARILEWVAISSSRESSRPRDRTCISCVPALAGEFFTTAHSPGAQVVKNLLPLVDKLLSLVV